MINFLTLFFLIIILLLILKIISRKQHEVAEKELQQKELLIQEMQTILNAQTSSAKEKRETIENSVDNSYVHQIAEHFKSEGYSISELSKAEGIDLIGIKEKELLLIRCESALKEVKKDDLLLFIGSCTLYVEHNPMFKNRSIVRIYSTSRPIREDARQFIRENSLSLRLNETH